MGTARRGGLRGLPIHERKGYWICYVRTADGRRLQRALHIRADGSDASERAAVAAYWQEQSRATAGAHAQKPRKPLGEALKTLTRMKELEQLSAHALDVVLYRGARLVEHFGPTYDLTQLDSPQPLVEYAAEGCKTRSGKTVRMELGILAQAMVAVGLPVPRIPRLDTAPKPQQPLTEEEQRRVILAATPKHRLTVLTYITLGPRLSEVNAIEAIDWNAATLHIAGTKTVKSKRTVPIPPELFALMSDMRARGEWRGFPQLSRRRLDTIIRTTCVRAGIGPRSANDLRGTASQRMRLAGVDAEVRAAIQGNSALMQQQTYTQTHLLLDVMREAVEATDKAARILPRRRKTTS